MGRSAWGLSLAANLLLVASVVVATVGLAEALRGAGTARVALVFVAALALWVAGAGADALGMAVELPGEPAAGAATGRAGRPGLAPDALLDRHPRATLRWLRGQLGLTPEAFAARLGVGPGTVAGWEALGRAIPPRHRRRLLPLLARALATAEGAAFLRSLGGEGPWEGTDA